MKRIILSLLTIVLLFSCQSEEDIVPDFTNQNKYPFTRSGGASTLFERLFDNYKTHPAYSWLVPLNQKEITDLYWNCLTVFGFYPIINKCGETLCAKGIRLHLGRDNKLNYSNGYYDSATNSIFFRKNFDIQYYDILHELLHATQHHIIGYSMNNSSITRNIEYEAYVARDILECIRRNGDFKDCPAMGIPNSKSEQEYRLWIHKISVYTIGRSPEVYSVIEEKFNLWAKNWDSYQDKKCSETFKPLLLYYIAENN